MPRVEETLTFLRLTKEFTGGGRKQICLPSIQEFVEFLFDVTGSARVPETWHTWGDVIAEITTWNKDYGRRCLRMVFPPNYQIQGFYSPKWNGPKMCLSSWVDDNKTINITTKLLAFLRVLI